MKVFISPTFNSPDKGEGGIRRVVEAQKRWLPGYGIEVVNDIEACDIAAFHAGEWWNPPKHVPVVAHTHGMYWKEYYWEHKWTVKANEDVVRSLKMADVTTAPSEWVAQSMRRNMWLDPVVLYHGIEPDEWVVDDKDKNEGYVLWNKTRVDPICDPKPVEELAKRVPDQHIVTTFFSNPDNTGFPNVKIVGREPYEQAKQRITQAGVYLATARETFGIGTLEAMAAGVPILGFDWGGQPEIVVHKEHGYLAKPGDYDDLALGLDYCLKHRAYLADNARTRVLEQFTWQHWIAQYASLYRDTILEARSRPKVSVIIPYFNMPQYVEEAVASAKEVLKNIKGEIIVVDDGSTEHLPITVPASGVTVLRNAKNQDLPATLNTGMRTARGQYVVSLDADNRLKNLNELVNALDQDRSLDIAYGRMLVFSDSSSRSWISDWPPEEANLPQQVAHKNQIPSTALYRKRIFSWVGGYRSRCYTAEDADFWTRALAVGAKARRVTNAVTLEYRDRLDSRSHVRKDWHWNQWYDWAIGPFRLATTGGPLHIHDTPKISVIIPVGPGHERYIEDALDSVQAQSKSFWDWEVIVINDSGKRLNVPPWARVVPNKHPGASSARNRGLLLSKGEYVLFLDADDYLHPDALYHFYNLHKTSTCDKSFVYSDWYAAETGKPVILDDKVDPIEVLGRMPYPVTCLYKRSDLFDARIGWDESFTGGWEDWDFAIQVAAAGICGLHLSAPMLHYRLNTGSLRASALAQSDSIKLKLKHKYNSYYSKEKSMPGCGGCGGGRYPSIMAAPTQTGIFDGVDLDKETTLVEYTPPPDWTGTRAFVGRKTGNRYRFGVDSSNRVRRVYNEDVQGLVDMGYFTVLAGAVGTVTPLEVPGPSGVGVGDVTSSGGPSA